MTDEAEQPSQSATRKKTLPVARYELGELYRFKVRTISAETRKKWIEAVPAQAPLFDDTAPPPIAATVEGVPSRAVATLQDVAGLRPPATDQVSQQDVAGLRPPATDQVSQEQAAAVLAYAPRMKVVAVAVFGVAALLVAAALGLWFGRAEPEKETPREAAPAPSASPRAAVPSGASNRGTRVESLSSSAPGVASVVPKQARERPVDPASVEQPAATSVTSSTSGTPSAEPTRSAKSSTKRIAQPKTKQSASRPPPIDIETPLFDD